MRLIDEFALDPAVLHWNHGSFGACPRAVLRAQDAVRSRLEAATMTFFVLEYPPLLAAARKQVAGFVGADPDGFALIPNATTAVATALADVRLGPGDEVITTDHEYRACRNALDRAAAAAGARVIVVPIALPYVDPAAVVAAIADRVTARTRLVLVDHVTSPTALVLDVAALARALPAEVALLVDGAHAPGQLALAIGDLGATYYAGNLHKWTCAPKGAGFLWVAPHRREQPSASEGVSGSRGVIRPLVTSHGASLATDGTTRFRLEHDWTGTHDPSPYLSVPAAIATVAALGGGWPAVRAHCHALVRDAITAVATALRADLLTDRDDGFGTMAALALELPDGAHPLAIERALLERGVEVPIVDHPAAPWPVLRLSAHLYNDLADVEPLVDHLRALGVRGRRFR